MRVIKRDGKLKLMHTLSGRLSTSPNKIFRLLAKDIKPELQSPRYCWDFLYYNGSSLHDWRIEYETFQFGRKLLSMNGVASAYPLITPRGLVFAVEAHHAPLDPRLDDDAFFVIKEYTEEDDYTTNPYPYIES